MKKLITVCQVLVILAAISSIVSGAQQVINYDERMIGANHPTLPDTINRGFLIEHDNDGTHKDNTILYGKLRFIGSPTDNWCATYSLVDNAFKWQSCLLSGGGGSGNYDPDNVAITKGTADNLVIGDNIPSRATFSTIATDCVTNTEFSYVKGLTGPIQTQINAKRASDNGTFLVEIVTPRISTTCSYSGNTCSVNMMDNNDPVGADLSGGDTWFKGSNNTYRQRNQDNTATISLNALPIPFVIYQYSASHDNVVRWQADSNQVLTQLSCNTGGTDNVTVTLYKCNANVGSCSTTGLVSAATSTTVTDSSASSGSILIDDWVKVSLSNLQGTPTSVACTVRYINVGVPE